ncbi:MAG: pyruvate/oxaloacetate carboxyltransferase [Methanomicrobia archaeon]|nr:pyruvate/oxaloacetate carboxyltransferase [Methanomicrobia archaeon]
MVQLHDQTFRDAHQSLLATRMRTEDMLPIAEKMDKIGFFSMEVWGGATFDVPIRYLNEDPWERLNKLKEAMPNTPMQMLERAMNIVAYWNFPDDIVMKFIEFAKKNGCDYFRIFDALNDLRNMKVPIETTKKVGAHAQGCLCYTISPVHTVDRYVEKFKELEKMGCDSLCIKDMAGMISPKRAYNIIKGCKDAGIKIPIDLHSHYTSGMTGMAYMRAIEAGADIVDTSMSPISGGTAQPATESIVAALKGTEWDTGYDLIELVEIRRYFVKIWSKYRHLHRFNALKVDPSVTVHQIPGGMLSNLIFQLEQQGIGDKYFEVLDETARVREELGYPPLVTPTSQVVGVQAVMNVKFGRYKKIPKETKDYCKGLYGTPPGEIKPEIMELVLGKDWKDQIITCRPADLLEPLYKKRRDELEDMGLIKKEEDVITYAIYPEVGLKFLKGEAKTEFTSKDLPLPVTHPFSRALIKSIFPELTDEEIEGIGGKGVGAIPTEFDVEVDGEIYDVKLTPKGYEVAKPAEKKKIEGGVAAGLQGTILKIKAKNGDKVKEGDVVVLLEAMKMENEIVSPKSGVIKDIFVKEGEEVSPDSILFAIGG